MLLSKNIIPLIAFDGHLFGVSSHLTVVTIALQVDLQQLLPLSLPSEDDRQGRQEGRGGEGGEGGTGTGFPKTKLGSKVFLSKMSSSPPCCSMIV
jgi:hypothetical protein